MIKLFKLQIERIGKCLCSSPVIIKQIHYHNIYNTLKYIKNIRGWKGAYEN